MSTLKKEDLPRYIRHRIESWKRLDEVLAEYSNVAGERSRVQDAIHEFEAILEILEAQP